jgi:hypothetical protein
VKVIAALMFPIVEDVAILVHPTMSLLLLVQVEFVMEHVPRATLTVTLTN